MTTSDILRLINGIAVLVAVSMIVSPLLGAVLSAFLWGNVVGGVVIVLLAGYNAYLAHDGEPVNRYVAYLAGFGGLWLIMFPFGILVEAPNVLLANFLAGGMIAILTGYTGYVGPSVSDRGASGQAA